MQEIRSTLGASANGWREIGNANGHARGVAIYLREPVANFVLQYGKNESHNLVWADIGTDSTDSLRVVSVYSPQVADRRERLSLMSDLRKCILDAQGRYVIGGDFNTVLDEHLDSSLASPVSGACPFRNALRQGALGLDIWRHLHPGTTEYTRIKKGDTVGSRLDMWLLPPTLLQDVRGCSILDCQLTSDHRGVLLEVNPPNAVILSETPRRLHRKLSLAGVRKEKLLSILGEVGPPPFNEGSSLRRLRKSEGYLVTLLRRGLNQVPHWERQCTTPRQLSPTWWQRRFAAGKLAKVMRLPSPSLTFLRDSAGRLLTDPGEVRSLACDQLRSFAGDTLFRHDPRTLATLAEGLPKVQRTPLPRMTLRDFDAIAARATKDKACGPDSLNLFIIRNLPRSWHSLYVDAVNDIIVGGMPAHYNSVEVTMLFKGGDPFLLSSYRPLKIGRASCRERVSSPV